MFYVWLCRCGDQLPKLQCNWWPGVGRAACTVLADLHGEEFALNFGGQR